jgi:hypothetical protein
MPRYDDNMETFQAPGNFGFSGVKIDRLSSTKYTLVTLCIDSTPSVSGYRDLIITTIKNIIKGCKLNKIIVDNILIRVVYFNSIIDIVEFHGFKEPGQINEDTEYESIDFAGMTNLCDANVEILSVLDKYTEGLRKSDFDNNAINFILTDGEDNNSRYVQMDVKNQLDEIKRKENTESILNILIGLTPDKQISDYLQRYNNNCGYDKYIDAQELTPENAAKLGNFIVEQISSQSSSCGTGSPSQVLQF